MRWPWSSAVEEAQREADDARKQAIGAAESHAHSVQRRIESEHVKEEAVEVTTVLWEDLRRNGWTEMLRQAWGGTPG
ncbi:DUF7620 family protein [Rhodococcus erythropolis]